MQDRRLSPSGSSALFKPVDLGGGLRLNNRIVMAPMTRSRAEEPSGVPSRHAAEYYAQRASAGLIVTEGTNISQEGKGYSRTPGIFTAEHVAAWREVTSAVHDRVAGSKIFLQLWHVGRVAHHDVSGVQPVAPSALRVDAKVWLRRPDGWEGRVDCTAPREMDQRDIARVVDDYRAAAERAMEAGFDGVEIHAANGYLIDQFLRGTTNQRRDRYGGSIKRRLQFVREVVCGVTRAVGAERVGIRFSPLIGFPDARDREIESTLLAAAEWLDGVRIGYVHIVESDNADLAADHARPGEVESVGPDFRREFRQRFDGPIVLAHRYDLARARHALNAGVADLIAFGRPFIANPDLVDRLKNGWPLGDSDLATWYGGTARGYVDYPVYQEYPARLPEISR